MSAEKYHYHAFISYRHLKRDMRIVRAIQTLTENYRSPCDGAYVRKGERINRLFTDRSELSTSADLNAALLNALAESHFLIVIACPEYLESKWCLAELRTFLAQNSINRVLFVRTGGTPSCITDILSAVGVSTQDESFKEPLYIDVCTEHIRNSVKIIKKEYLRLAAALIGCSYDQLYQRHKRQRRRRALAIAATALILITAVAVFFKIANDKRVRAENYRDMDSTISSIYTLLDSGDATQALISMKDICSRYGQNPEYAAYLTKQLETAVFRASYIPAYSPFAVEPLPTEQSMISISSDGQYLIAYDIDTMRDTGEMKTFLYDSYLRKISEHVLSVGDWGQEILLDVITGGVVVDYDAEKGIFTIERSPDNTRNTTQTPGERRFYALDGKHLPDPMPVGNNHKQIPAAIRTMYEELVLADNRPGCMNENGVYTIITDQNGGFSPFGSPEDIYQVIFVPESCDRYYIIASISYHSDLHAIEELSITPDGSSVIVRESQGIYNDVLTVCDAMGNSAPVKIDTGNNTVDEMLCHIDPDAQEQHLLLLNLDEAGSFEGSLVGCSIVNGDIHNCERYNGKDFSSMQLSSQGYVYLISDYTDIIALTTRNICLPELLSGISADIPVRTAYAENDLIEDAARFKPTSTQYMGNAPFGTLTISSECDRMHFFTPVGYSGVDIGVAILDSAGSAIVQFFDQFSYAYYSAEDGAFGLINYDDPEASQLFKLYDLQALMQLLEN